MNIQDIIKCIDDYLKKSNKSSIDPVEANKILERKDLLKDNKSRPGKPLRDILRKGLIAHAYQSGGKGSSWVIPLSSVKNTIGSNYTKNPKISVKKEKNKDQKMNSENIDEILAKIENARLKYKPEKVKYLLVAEAPPDTVERFFYFEDVTEHDYLFIGIAEALYPDLKEQYLDSKRSEKIKTKILEKFKSDNFYLIDFSDLPLSLLNENLSNQLPNLKNKIKDIADEDTKIILIKANVYDIAYPYLIAEKIENVINKRISFPGQGWQNKFQVEFAEALKDTRYR